MSYITDIKWQGASTFEDIDIWFCGPMKEFIRMFDDEFGEDHFGPGDKRVAFYYFEMTSKMDDLTKLLYRLCGDYQENPIPEKRESISSEGLTVLKNQAFRKKLSPYQRDIYDQLVKKFREDILDDPDKEAIKEYLREQQGCESAEVQRSHVSE